MKRTWLLVLLISWLLSACAPASTPTPAPSATSLPMATASPTSTSIPTATPTQVPLTPQEQFAKYLETQEAKQSIADFVNAMKMAGIVVSAEQVAQGITIIDKKADGSPLVDKDGKPFYIATYNLDPDPNTKGKPLEGPIPLMIYDEKEGWREIEPRILDEKNIYVDFGVQLDFYDYNNPKLANIASILWSSPFMRTWVEQHGTSQANKLISLVAKNDQILYMHPGLWHLDIDSELKKANSREAVLSYIEKIANSYMWYAKKAYQQTNKPVLINFINEPWWADPPNRPVNVGWLESPYYRYLGKDYIVDAYVAFYNAGVAQGMMPEQDFRLIISVDGIFFPNPKLSLTINYIEQAKQKIAQRLNIPVEQVQLDLAIQWRFDKNVTGGKTSTDGRYRLPSTKEIQNALKQISSHRIPFHVTEFEIANVSDAEFNKFFADFSKIAIAHGARSITVAGLSHTSSNPYREIRHALFESGRPTSTYYAYLETLLEASNVK